MFCPVCSGLAASSIAIRQDPCAERDAFLAWCGHCDLHFSPRTMDYDMARDLALQADVNEAYYLAQFDGKNFESQLLVYQSILSSFRISS